MGDKLWTKRIVEYEAHPICTAYPDGDHRRRTGYYVCECGATTAWHKTKNVNVELVVKAEEDST